MQRSSLLVVVPSNYLSQALRFAPCKLKQQSNIIKNVRYIGLSKKAYIQSFTVFVLVIAVFYFVPDE